MPAEKPFRLPWPRNVIWALSDSGQTSCGASPTWVGSALFEIVTASKKEPPNLNDHAGIGVKSKVKSTPRERSSPESSKVPVWPMRIGMFERFSLNHETEPVS